MNAPSELEEYLKPAVKQMLNEKRIAYQYHLQQVGAPSSHVRNNIGNSRSFLEKHTIFRPLSHLKQEFEYSSPLGLPIQEEKKGESTSTLCVIFYVLCLDALIPCGNMASSMCELNEVKLSFYLLYTPKSKTTIFFFKKH